MMNQTISLLQNHEINLKNLDTFKDRILGRRRTYKPSENLVYRTSVSVLFYRIRKSFFIFLSLKLTVHLPI